jgi:hypothetical protein
MAVQNNYNNVLRDGLRVALTGSQAGDIFYRSGNGAFTRLGVGAEGQVLKVSSGNLPVWGEADKLTTEDIQDAVGGLFTDSPSIDFMYDDAAGSMAASLVDGSVTNSKIRDSAATSLIGRPIDSAGSVSDIAFTTDGQVLMRSGGTLAPVDLKATVIAYRVDEFASPTSAVSFSGQQITDLASPSLATDATNKAYVDNALQGVPYKSYVRTASAEDIDIAAPGVSIGGIALTAGQNFLLYGQEDPTENGVYTYVSATAPATRRSDLELVPGMTIFVDEGTEADTTYQLTSNGPITVGTSDIAFTVFGRVESITVSSPLVRVGNNIAVTDNGITPAYMQEFPAATILGNPSANPADASYLTKAQVLGLLGLANAMSEEYVVVADATATMVPQKAYRPTNASLTTFTLPTACPEGAVISIEGMGAGGWSIAQGAGQVIVYGDLSSTAGTTGRVSSMHERDVIKLRCIAADSTFQVISSIGNLDII